MNSRQGTGCRRWKGQCIICVKEQERVAGIQVHLSVSPGPREGVTRGKGQLGPSELLCVSSTIGSCLLQICYLSVTSAHWYFASIVCVVSSALGTFTSVCVCVCVPVVRLWSAFRRNCPCCCPLLVAMPPSCHLPLHTANILREWQIEISSRSRGSLSCSAPAQRLLPNAMIFSKKALPANSETPPSPRLPSFPLLPARITTVESHTKAICLKCPQSRVFHPHWGPCA